MSTDYVVYALVDSRSPADIRYIGITNSPRRRIASHISEARRGGERGHKGAWIRSVLAAGATIEMQIVAAHLDRSEAAAMEVKHISDALSGGARLTNTTSGGYGGMAGSTHCEDARRRIGEASSARPRSLETRGRLSATARRLGPQKNSPQGFKGVTYDAQRRKWSARITIDGKRIKLGRFESPDAAARAFDQAAIAAWGEDTFTNFRR